MFKLYLHQKEKSAFNWVEGVNILFYIHTIARYRKKKRE